jgi:hypothetical protein
MQPTHKLVPRIVVMVSKEVNRVWIPYNPIKGKHTEMASLKNFIRNKDKIGLTTFQHWLERFFIGAGYTNSVYINPRNQLQRDSFEKEYH